MMAKINIKKIILTKDVILKKGTILMDTSNAISEFSSDWYQGLVSINKDNCAYFYINLDTLKEGQDFIIIIE